MEGRERERPGLEPGGELGGPEAGETGTGTGKRLGGPEAGEAWAGTGRKLGGPGAGEAGAGTGRKLGGPEAGEAGTGSWAEPGAKAPGGRKAGIILEKTAAIVVTYNRCELLKECIEALLASEAASDILIVDNGSTDGTGEMVSAYLPTSYLPGADSSATDMSAAGLLPGRVSYLNTGENLGGAGGFQLGIRKAYEAGYAYFWLMDDDTIVQPDTLGRLLEAGEKLGGAYGFLSSLALWKDGSECRMNYHTIAADWNLEKKKVGEGILRVETATFVSFLVRREVVAQAGLPIKEYFIWGDDTEYSRRISGKFACYLVAGSRVVHKMAQNIPSGGLVETGDEARVERMFYSVRNDCCTWRRAGWKRFLRYTVNTLHLLLDVVRRSRRLKGKKVRVIVRGYVSGLFFRPRIERVD